MRHFPQAFGQLLRVLRPGAAGALLAAVLPVLATQASAPTTPAAPAAQLPPAQKVAQAGSRATTRPNWNELTAAQQQALQPLAGTWGTLSVVQKRNWIALSRNYRRMSSDEQAKLHSRMTDWARLSPQQRTQARLNFGETRTLSADDRKAKWEAYQSLSPEERSELAARSGSKPPPPTAAALKPARQKLAKVPANGRSRKAKPPRIAVSPPPGSPAAPVLTPLPDTPAAPN